MEAIGLGAAKQESQIWTAIKQGLKPGTPAQWPDNFVRLTWRLKGKSSADIIEGALDTDWAGVACAAARDGVFIPDFLRHAQIVPT